MIKGDKLKTHPDLNPGPNRSNLFRFDLPNLSAHSIMTSRKTPKAGKAKQKSQEEEREESLQAVVSACCDDRQESSSQYNIRSLPILSKHASHLSL